MKPILVPFYSPDLTPLQKYIGQARPPLWTRTDPWEVWDPVTGTWLTDRLARAAAAAKAEPVANVAANDLSTIQQRLTSVADNNDPAIHGKSSPVTDNNIPQH